MQKMWASCSVHVLSTRGAMLSGPLALLGFTSWNGRRTSSSLVWSLWKSSSAADALFKTLWIWLCFHEKSWQSKRLKNRFSWLASSAVFTENIFCVLPFTYLLINFIPVYTLLILLHVKWLSTFCSYCSFSFRMCKYLGGCHFEAINIAININIT